MAITRVVLLCIPLFALCETPNFREHVIASGLKGGYQVLAVDLNRDGRPDLIALASGMPDLVWYENTGLAGKQWPRHVIASGFNRMINAVAQDVDGDGYPELLLAHEFANEAAKSAGVVSLLHGQNDDPYARWSVREVDRLTTSHRLRSANIDGRGRRVIVNAPLTGASAVPPGYDAPAPLFYYDTRSWTRHLITDQNRGVVHGVYVFDWNGNGHEDVITASFSGVHIHTLLPDGSWKRAVFSTEPASDIAVGKLGSVRIVAAIEPWHGNRVAVYNGGLRQIVDSSLVDGHTILTADFDEDGADEIVAGCRAGPKSVFLYRHDGTAWKRQAVDNGGMGAAACTAADLNGDKHPDLACIDSSPGTLKWYENVTHSVAAR